MNFAHGKLNLFLASPNCNNSLLGKSCFLMVMSTGSAHTAGQGTATAEDRPLSSTTTSGAKLSKAGRWTLGNLDNLNLTFCLHRSVNVENFEVAVLKDEAGKSFSNHEAVEATIKLID